MPLQPVPWATGNGADNPVEGARLALHAATSGARGVAGPDDMRVTALPVPGGAVRVHTGAGVTPNDYIPGGGAQAYAMREESHTDVPIPATGSGGGATRYLIARVQDPQYAGAEPEDVVNGPYNHYAIVGSKDGHKFPYVPLAKIVQPANTATITNEMITDVREVANPREKTVRFPRPVVNQHIDGYSHVLRHRRNGTGHGRGEQFPDSANGGRFDLDIPEWATRMHVDARWTSVRYNGQSSWGAFYLQYVGKDGVWRSTQDFGWDVNEGNIYTTNWLLSDNLFIPYAMRGGRLSIYMRAFVEDNSNAKQGAVSLNKRSGLHLDVTFYEVADWTGWNTR
ncbi:hypothetical protein [Brevibacterium luteolum]|uniref:Uncharacterized protein n=2 Tax=Brevibacterium luteolum TaxID=199591 RepID=A0A849AXN9_9MICO|nr:hypothetical protein [Brevibacterium luteolum]MBM7530450.1 hypothetical protein [Brevibacterium luteolum]NNG77846.1 hypothetical protein [Brevibacterium luteolum]